MKNYKSVFVLLAVALLSVSCQKTMPYVDDEVITGEATKAAEIVDMSAIIGLWVPDHAYPGYETEDGIFEPDLSGVIYGGTPYLPLSIRSSYYYSGGDVTYYGTGIVWDGIEEQGYLFYEPWNVRKYYFKTSVCRKTGEAYYLKYDQASRKIKTNITPFEEESFDFSLSEDGQKLILFSATGRKSESGADLYHVVEFSREDPEDTAYTGWAVSREDENFLETRKAYLDDHTASCKREPAAPPCETNEDYIAMLRIHWEAQFDELF
ncbi:MAG: hypothetical protein K6D54_03875 [Bacteroidales bacterium]|nr:hypothetical protein [Bacteroidales bacterium]